MNNLMEQMFSLSEEFLAGVAPIGDNPSVFTYRFARHKENELLEFTYYGRNKVVVVLNHVQSLPPCDANPSVEARGPTATHQACRAALSIIYTSGMASRRRSHFTSNVRHWALWQRH